MLKRNHGRGKPIWPSVAAVMAIGVAAMPTAAIQILSTSDNTTVTLGLTHSELEFENPLMGGERVLDYRIVEWLDADYSPPGWYDDWVPSSAGIDGCASEIWLRTQGQYIETATSIPSSIVSIHLNGDSNDGIAIVYVDDVEVAKLDMGTTGSADRAFILVEQLQRDTHTIMVFDNGAGSIGSWANDVATLGAAVIDDSDLQACCLQDGTCLDVRPADCVQVHGGVPMGPGTNCDSITCAYYKWLQPPTFRPDTPMPECFAGWDEKSVFGAQVVADDWRCGDDRPITDIHWWGSYQGWDAPNPPLIAPQQFHVGIWTDMPAGMGLPYSHPGTLIWEFIAPRTMLSERPVGCDFIPSDLMPDTCFRYDLTLPAVKWFYQTPNPDPTIYWLSVAAIYPGAPGGPPEFAWGWKTRDHFFNDQALAIFNPVAPSIPIFVQFVEGMPIESPEPGMWDMAFALTTNEPMPMQACCYPDGGCVDLIPPECVAGGGVPQGFGSDCGSIICPNLFEACCYPDGVCEDLLPNTCLERGGQPQGAGTDCDTTDCPILINQACCFPDGTCTDTTPANCILNGGVPQGADTDCDHTDCPVLILQACCYPTGACADLTPNECTETGGVPRGMGTECATTICPVLHISKWTQLPHQDGTGFDAPSDLWWHEPMPPDIKWDQGPDIEWPGLHSPPLMADDWICEGGVVTDLHWWGNYELGFAGEELRGQGILHFRLSIHGHLDPDAEIPFGRPGPPLWQRTVTVNEIPTSMVNIEGSRIYKYEYVLDEPFEQILGGHYWFDLEVVAASPDDPPLWRWQEAGRNPAPTQSTAVSWVGGGIPGPWRPIIWSGTDPILHTDLAFAVTSEATGTGFEIAPALGEPNKVVADDFISDGRPIKAVRWWGSYWDDRYIPFGPVIDPLHVVDGWFISFHGEGDQCPPDGAAGIGDPTVLGVYFAPAAAVRIVPMPFDDCFDHQVFRYDIDLERCILICAEVDPRDGAIPAEPVAFREVHGFRYWLDIVAVVGAVFEEGGIPVYTPHLPSDLTVTGHFWGWHTSPAESMAAGPLNEACSGRILDFDSIGPNECWDYGFWQTQPYLCPVPFAQRVDMAFMLLTYGLKGDFDFDGDVDLVDFGQFQLCYTGAGGGPIPPECEPGDFDGDGDVDLVDFGGFQLAFTGPMS